MDVTVPLVNKDNKKDIEVLWKVAKSYSKRKLLTNVKVCTKLFNIYFDMSRAVSTINENPHSILTTKLNESPHREKHSRPTADVICSNRDSIKLLPGQCMITWVISFRTATGKSYLLLPVWCLDFAGMPLHIVAGSVLHLW